MEASELFQKRLPHKAFQMTIILLIIKRVSKDTLSVIEALNCNMICLHKANLSARSREMILVRWESASRGLRQRTRFNKFGTLMTVVPKFAEKLRIEVHFLITGWTV